MPAALKVSRRRLSDAWGIYRETHFPLLSPRTRCEYETCYERAHAELGPVLTLRTLQGWRNRLATAHNFGESYVNLHVFTLRTVSRRAGLHTGDRELERLCWAVQPMRAGERWVPCPPADFLVRPELQASLAWAIAHRALLVPPCGSFRGRSDGYLYPWAETYLEGFLVRIRAHLGADAERYMPTGVGWHHFRRWGATTMARRGSSVWQVLQWLRDKDPAMAAHYVDVGRGAADCLLLSEQTEL